jgi:hypothetical protein
VSSSRFTFLHRYHHFLIQLCRDGAYVQFIRPKGKLEDNLRAQLKA